MNCLLTIYAVFLSTTVLAQHCSFDSLVEQSRIIFLGENHKYNNTTNQLIKNIVQNQYKYDTVCVVMEIPFSISDAINNSIQAQDIQRLKEIARLDPVLKINLNLFLW